MASIRRMLSEVRSIARLLTGPEPTNKPRLPVDLPGLLRETEDRHIAAALAQAGGSKVEAAKLLGINRTTLVEKLRRRRAL